MNKELIRHGGVLGVYLLSVVVFRWQWGWNTVWWILGGFIGFCLVYLDRLIYVYWLHPQEELSQLVRDLIRQHRWRLAFKEVHQRANAQLKLTTRSVLFALAWMLLALFAVTSTGSGFAGGLLMGLGLHMLYDFWRDEQLDPVALNKKLFWQVKREISLEEQKKFLYFFTGAFIIMTLIVI